MDSESSVLIYRTVGVGIAICAGFGILMTLVTWTKLSASVDEEDKDPVFRKFFVLFSSLSLLYNVLLAGLAALLIATYYIPWWVLLIVSLLPWIYTFWLGNQWRNPEQGMTLGAATGIGNVGMAIPTMLLLPIWGPIALWIAS